MVPKESTLKQYKILVTDDEPELRDLLGSELISRGHTVMTATNGFEAVELARSNEFDGILSDIRMPNGNGRFVLHNVRVELKQKCVVYLLTGYSDISAAEAFQLGANGLIFKPYLMANLFDRFESAIDRNGHFVLKSKIDGSVQFFVNDDHQLFWGSGGFSLVTDPVPWLLDSTMIVQLPTPKGLAKLECALRFRTVRKNKHVLGFELLAVEEPFDDALVALMSKNSLAFIPNPEHSS